MFMTLITGCEQPTSPEVPTVEDTADVPTPETPVVETVAPTGGYTYQMEWTISEGSYQYLDKIEE